MTDVEATMRPWLDRILQDTGPLELYDAHTHIGQNDPDGFKQTPEELVGVLERADARAVVFPMHEPGGYPLPNDIALAAAAASDRLVAFCRLDPRVNPAAEARRCLDAGAVGIKLHPRAEQFGMDEPGVREIVAVAHERKVPILIHAGRGIPALGAHVLEYASEFRDARFILAADSIARPRVLIDIEQRGVVEVQLQGPEAPLTVANFVRLVERRFFDGHRWHRVVPNFVIQDGDPRGDGFGGPGGSIRDEINLLRYEAPMLGMALSGPDTGGSQWFINLSPQPHLDGTYTVFGKVVGGLAVLVRITQGELIRTIRMN